MQISSSVRQHFSSAQKDKILRAYQRSQLTQKQFAAQAGVGVSTLCAWLRKAALNPSGGGSGFLPVPNLLSASTAEPTYRLEWPDGLSLEVRSGFAGQELTALLQALRAV